MFSFTARLPELSKELNRKLGGPVAASPPKPKKPSGHNDKAPIKPGSTLKRSVSGASGTRSLEEVFESDQQKWKASRKPVDVLARMRSATPATIPGLKREASEPLGLGSIPQGNNKTLKERSRNAFSRSASIAGPEDTKALKQAKMEAELQEAISAIKKPNRQMAGKVIVEEAEKRVVSSNSPHPRSESEHPSLWRSSAPDANAITEQKKPVRYAASASRVQVKATPANYRFRDAMPADSRGYGSLNLPAPRTEMVAIPSSSSMIPSTAPRKGFRDDLRNDLAAFYIASTPDKVLATPVAAPGGAAPVGRPTTKDAFILPSSPIMARKPAAAALMRDYLAVPRGAVDTVGPSSLVLPSLFETPVKQRPVANSNNTEQEDITSTPPEPLDMKIIKTTKSVLFETPAKRTSTFTSAPVSAAPTEQPSRGRRNNNDNDDGNPPGKNKPAIAAAPLTLAQQLGWDDYDFDNL